MNKVINLLKEQLYPISLYMRQIAGTLILFIIAHYMPIYDYGLFTSYKAIIVFCFMFANMEFANYILVSSGANVKKTQLKISLFMLNAINICFLIMLGSLFFKLDEPFLFLLITIRTFFDGVFFMLILPYFQASRKFNVIALINLVYASCIVLIAIISFILKLSLVKFLLLNIALGFINFIQCSYYAKINYFMAFKNIRRFCKMLDKSIFGYMGSMVTDYLYAQTSSLYVAIFLSKEDAALYFSATTISMIVSILTVAQTQKILPDLMNSNIQFVKNVLKKNLFILSTLLFGVLLIFILFGKFILKLLYGQDYYINAHMILVLCCIANIFIANGGLFGAYLTAINKQYMKIRLKLETTIITIIGLICLHKLGVYGVLIVLLISSVYISMRFTFTSIKYLRKGVIYEKRV